MKAIILAAGKGNRLAPLTNNTPKPLLDIGEQLTPLKNTLDIILPHCTDIYIVINHLGDKIKTYITENYSENNNIFFAPQKERNGTYVAVVSAVEAFPNILHEPDTNVIVVSGDDYYMKNDLEKLIAIKNSFALGRKIMGKEYYSFEVNTENIITGKHQQTEEETRVGALVAVGCYNFELRNFLTLEPVILRDGELGLPQTLLQDSNIKQNAVIFENWFPINTLEDLETVREYINKIM